MHCYHLVATTVSIRKPAPPFVPAFVSIQCFHHSEGPAPSFAFVLWIDDSCNSTFVDGILTLDERGERREREGQ